MYESNLSLNLGSGISVRRFTYTYLDLQALSGSGAKSVAMFTLPVGAVILGVRAQTVTAFTGGSLSAMTLLVGKSGTTNYFTSAFDIFATASDTTVQETALFKHGNKAALAVIATFTPTGDTVAAATAGQVDVDVWYGNVTTDTTTIP